MLRLILALWFPVVIVRDDAKEWLSRPFGSVDVNSPMESGFCPRWSKRVWKFSWLPKCRGIICGADKLLFSSSYDCENELVSCSAHPLYFQAWRSFTDRCVSVMAAE